jgi:prevent-host-death family protein
MKSISIMEAQHNLAKWLREVESGHELVITRRNKAVARLSPPKSNRNIVFPNFKKRAQSTWKKQPHKTSSDELLNESRGDR